MPNRTVCAASLLILAAGLAAGEADDVTLSYSFEDVAAGRDINEGIYGSHGAGEFDEWRLHLGLAPGFDRIQLKTTVNGAAYLGDEAVEKDKVLNDPPLPPQIGLVWVLGDYEAGDQGWFTTFGLEYTRRSYQIIYQIQVLSNELDLQSLTVHLGMGYGWYITSRFRYEIQPFINAGLLWTDLDLVDMDSMTPSIESDSGPLIEGGLRNSLIWHPGNSQAWHLGLSLDYRTGYAQTIFQDEGAGGTVRSEVRFWWYGFGGSLFYGHKF